MCNRNKSDLKQCRFFFAGIVCALLLIIGITMLQSFPTNYVILIEDTLFKTWFKNAETSIWKNKGFVLKPLSSVEKKCRLFSNTSIPVAIITTEKFYSFDARNPKVQSQEKNGNGLCLYYTINESVLVPALAAEFQGNGKLSSTDAPNISLSLTSPEALPKNFRALPVNGVYAGEENYPLTVQNKVRCTILNAQFKDAVSKFCSQIFTGAVAKRKETAFVASVGDIMLGRGVQDILLHDKHGIQKVFTDTLPILQNNDITIGNLEGAITESENKLAKTYTFKFHKEVLAHLKAAGFNYLMLSNNHCYDYGETGFKDTIAALREYGIPTSGAGLNDDEAKRFYRTEKKGEKFSIISCGMYPIERSGFNGKKTATAKETRAGILWAGDEVLAAIAKEKSAGNFVIVNVHGGTEYQFTPNEQQRSFYRSLCDAGADLVFGTHPHVLQPTEWYNGSLIVYSLGNFIFNGMNGLYGACDTEIVRIGIYDGIILYVEKYPARIDGCRVLLR